MDGLQWKTLLKWMIWGYPYFWKHPYQKPTGISMEGRAVLLFLVSIHSLHPEVRT